MTAGRERSAEASLCVAARDRVSRSHPSAVVEVDIAEGEPTAEQRERFEDEMVAIVADVLVRRRTIAA